MSELGFVGLINERIIQIQTKEIMMLKLLADHCKRVVSDTKTIGYSQDASKPKEIRMKKLLILFMLTLFVSIMLADGTEPTGNPREVSTLDHLLWISTNTSSWEDDFIQTANIDASATSGWEFGFGFTPIGNDDDASFDGSYDGQNYTIDGLYINRPDSYYIGFFGETYDATIDNLGLTNVDITAFGYVGGLVGYSDASNISNCYVTGSIDGEEYVAGLIGGATHSPINDCYTSGSVSGVDITGGLVGTNEYSNISNSHSDANVTGDYDTGGCIGMNDNGTINNCYSEGTITGNDFTGGLAGEANYGTNNNCYNTGSIIGGSFTGGLVGTSSRSAFNYCYNTGEVSGSGQSAGLVGYLGNNDTVSNCYNSGNVTVSYTENGGLVGSANSSTISDSYNVGDVVNSSGGDTGGLVGWSGGPTTIDNCYHTGIVSGTSSGIGGLLGIIYLNNTTVTNSFWDIQTSGQLFSAGGTGKTTAEMTNVVTFTDETTVGLTTAWDFVTNPNDDVANNLSSG